MPRLSQDPANLAPFIATPAATRQARRVQTANTTANRPNTSVREIGNETLVGINFDPSTVAISVEANLVNARLLSIFANFDPAHTWTGKSLQDMIGYADVDVLMLQRNVARTAWLQSVYVRQAAIGSYRMAASTTAAATETFDLASDNKTAFEKFVVVENLTATSANQTNYTLSGTPYALTRGQLSGNKLISAAFSQPSGSSTYMLETDDYGVSGTTVSISNAAIVSQIATGTQFLFAYQLTAATPGGDQFQAKDTVSPASILGYYHIPVTITANGNGLRARGVQSVEATMDFKQQREVGMGSQAVGTYRDIPADVTGNFVIWQEDYNAEELMIAGTETPTDLDFPLEAFRDDISLKLEFKHPQTHQVLRIDTLSGLTITGDAKNVAVGQQVGKQYTFAASQGFVWYVDKLA